MVKIQIPKLPARGEAAKSGAEGRTCALQAAVPDAGEIVALAAGPVDLSVGGRVAQALPAVAVASPAAGAVLGWAPAGAGTEGALVALAARPHVAGAAHTHPALQGAFPLAALRALLLGLGLAVTAAEGMNFHLQHVAEPHRFYLDKPSGFVTRRETNSHIERDLEERMGLLGVQRTLQGAQEVHAEDRARGS